MGLSEEVFWGLCQREYRAQEKVWKDARDHQMSMLAQLRADIHNTAGRGPFDRTWSREDFMPGAKSASIEERIYQLIEQGYPPAAAAAMATSSQTRSEKLNIVKTTLDNAQRLKAKGRTNRAG